MIILYFHLSLDTKFEQYREHYAQTHEIVSNESNLSRNINYAINRFLNICVNRSVSKESTLVMIVTTFVSILAFLDKVQSDVQSKIKNVIIITIKKCIFCEKKFHTTNECREQFNLKQDRNQFDEKEDDRDNKRRRKNDNDSDEKHHSNVEDEDDDDEHKIYIVINLNILTLMSVMSREIAH